MCATLFKYHSVILWWAADDTRSENCMQNLQSKCIATSAANYL